MSIPVGKKAGPDSRTPGLAPHLDRALGLALDLILGLGLAIGAMLLLSIALTKPANAVESATQRHLLARQCEASVTRVGTVPDTENWLALKSRSLRQICAKWVTMY